MMNACKVDVRIVRENAHISLSTGVRKSVCWELKVLNDTHVTICVQGKQARSSQPWNLFE